LQGQSCHELTSHRHISEETRVVISIQEEKETLIESNAADEEKPSEETSKPRNPINWYGVLIPPPLREAQKSFIDVVDNSIPNVINITAQLRQLEIDIGRTRKTIKKLEKSEISILQTPETVAH
jgi:hypothetical protein